LEDHNTQDVYITVVVEVMRNYFGTPS